MTSKEQEEGLYCHEHLSGRAEEEHEEQPGYPIFVPRIETRAFLLLTT
jgi:hypothetical protein